MLQSTKSKKMIFYLATSWHALKFGVMSRDSDISGIVHYFKHRSGVTLWTNKQYGKCFEDTM